MRDKLKKIRAVCRGALRVVVFYILTMWGLFQLSPLFGELYFSTPFVLSATVSFFLVLFIVRMAGTLVFMPKPRLTAILREGESSPRFSKIAVRFFSWEFQKRLMLFLSLFVAEFIVRLVLVNLFLLLIEKSVPVWANLSMKSVALTNGLITLAAFAVMELPCFVLFYKLSFKGHANRLREYRFGLKLSFLTLLIVALHYFLLPLAEKTNAVVELAVVAVSGVALWILTYRTDFLKSLLCRQKRAKEEKDLTRSYRDAAKVAETIIEIEGAEIPPDAENGG